MTRTEVRPDRRGFDTALKPVTLPGIDAYAEAHSSPDPQAYAALGADLDTMMGLPDLVSGHVVGGLLRMLVHGLRPRLVVDVGTFTGYSALAMASQLPANGRLITCEVDAERAAAAGRHIARSPYADRITVRLGPALEVFGELTEPVDLVFIDADKPRYRDYVEAALPMLSDNGLIVCDNTLWRGEVLDDPPSDPDARAICAFNDAIADDSRLECVLLTVRDGVTLIRRHD